MQNRVSAAPAVAASQLPEATESGLLLAVLECRPGKVLTKRFEADGTKHDFTAGKFMRVHELAAATWAELLASLTWLVDCPEVCVVRGVPVSDCPRACEPNEWIYRRKLDREGEPATFLSVARHWVIYDFDDTATPFDLADPEGSIRAWHATLPPELRAARSAFFPSASAHASPCVRGKLVVWYKRPVNEARAAAFAVHYRADPSVARCVQPIFFAAPIFDNCADPLAGRRAPIVFEGVDGVEVADAAPPPPKALKATKARPSPVALKSLPPGDAGIVAALGPQAELVGLRFAIVGQLGGLMRRLGFTREQCAAIVQAWIPPVDLAPRITWALGAWDKPAETVSALRGFVTLVGDAHTNVIYSACLAARSPTRRVLGGAAQQ
jgi:hypothetical protein